MGAALSLNTLTLPFFHRSLSTLPHSLPCYLFPSSSFHLFLLPSLSNFPCFPHFLSLFPANSQSFPLHPSLLPFSHIPSLSRPQTPSQSLALSPLHPSSQPFTLSTSHTFSPLTLSHSHPHPRILSPSQPITLSLPLSLSSSQLTPALHSLPLSLSHSHPLSLPPSLSSSECFHFSVKIAQYLP